MKPVTVATTATFEVVESAREKGFSVHVSFETGDYLHLSGPWPTREEAEEHLREILEKRGIEPKSKR